jgi:hypothetical protein
MLLSSMIGAALMVLVGLWTPADSLADATPTPYLCPTQNSSPCLCAQGGQSLADLNKAMDAELCVFTAFSGVLSRPILSTNMNAGAQHCLDANGSELCGLQVVLSVGPNSDFETFLPESNVLLHVSANKKTLRVNWIAENSVPPSPISPIYLGRIILGSGQSFESAATTIGPASAAVTSDLKVVSAHSGPIQVPEPAPAHLWSAGLIALGLLAMARARRAQALLIAGLAMGGGASPSSADLVQAWKPLYGVDLGLSGPSELGTVLAGVGDLNGDGVEDVAIGFPSEFGGLGGVVIAFLRPDGTVNATQLITDGKGGFPSGSLGANSAFGSSMAVLTDIDGSGSGAVALAVAAPGTTPTGAVWLLILTPGSTGQSWAQIVGTIEIPTPAAADSLAAIGDINADSLPDLAVGYASYAGPTCPGTKCGAISVLHIDAPAGSYAFQGMLEDPNGALDGALFGSALAALGNANTYGTPAIAVGAPGQSGSMGAVSLLTFEDAGNFAWGISLSYGSDYLPSPLVTGDRFGAALAATSDLDNNGQIDLVVGIPGRSGLAPSSNNSGSIAFYNISSSMLIETSAQELDAQSGEISNAFGPTSDGVPTEFGLAVASVDQDGDGDLEIWVGAATDKDSTSQGVAWRVTLSDPDRDLLPDAIGDNCPGVYNPGQVDSDLDGFGDKCDNCPNAANGADFGICTGGDDLDARGQTCTAHADCGSDVESFCSLDQSDLDDDGIGDACEQVVVRLEESITHEWSLRLDCGAYNIEDLSVSVYAPDSSEALNLEMGIDNTTSLKLGCSDPGNHFFGNAIPSGNGCANPLSGIAISGIGSTIGLDSGTMPSDASGVYTAPSGATVGGLRANTLYLWLEGVVVGASGNRRICSAGDEDVFLADFQTPAGLTPPTNLSLTASNMGAFSFASTSEGPVPDTASCLVSSPYPAQAPAKSASRALSFFGPQILVDVSPLPPESGYQDWEVCFKADTFMHQIKLAVEPPAGTYDTSGGTAPFTRADISWVGCNHLTGLCAPGNYPVTNNSSIISPDNGDPNSSSKRYIRLIGSRPGYSSRLNSTRTTQFPNRFHCVGKVRVTHGTQAIAHAPNITLHGDPYLDTYIQHNQSDYHKSPFFKDEAGYAAADKNTGCTVPEDNDNDGVRKEADNCPNFPNALQQDTGGLDPLDNQGTLAQDGIGDGCQCGEGDGDGIIKSDGAVGGDLSHLRKHLLGQDLPGFDPKRCNIKDDPQVNTADCNILDAVLLQRVLEGAAPLPSPGICEAAKPIVP